MPITTALKAVSLCLLLVGAVLLAPADAYLVPYVIGHTTAAVFAAYHLVKYDTKRKIVVQAICAVETSYAISYWIALLHYGGVVSDSVAELIPAVFMVSMVAMPVAAFSMLAIRRPLRYHEGILDFVVAVAALATLQWELNGRGGEGVSAALNHLILPIVCVVVVTAGARIVWRLFADPRQNRYVVGAQTFGLITAAAGYAGFTYYGDAMTPGTIFTQRWTGALDVLSAFLICMTFLHRDSSAEFQKEEGFENSMSIMRWLGPAAALLTNPVMFGVLIYRGTAPSLPLGICSFVLALLVIWRISRLFAEREAARVRSELGEKRLQSLVQYAADVIIVTKAGGEITYVSPGIFALTGERVEDVQGRQIQSFVGEKDVERIAAAIDADGFTAFEQDIALQHADGPTRWVAVKVTNHRNDPSVEGLVWNVHDVTDRKTSEEAMSRLALYDQLTGLPNRTQMRDRLETYLQDDRNISDMAVLFCDLDGFKSVNDLLGHEAGDEVLQAVAGRWSAVLRSDDVLGRWGGDEFLVLCPITDIEAARAIAARLVAALDQPLTLGKRRDEAHVGASIGVVMGHRHEQVDALLRRADAAMYIAKRTSVPVHVA